VLALTVEDPLTFLETFGEAMRESPGIGNIVSHIMPAQIVFDFATAEEFESLARKKSVGWLGALSDRSFHVRLHRRGLKGTLATPREERLLDEALLSALASGGMPGRIEFKDPDAMIQIETIGGRAGMSLWKREELQRYDFLGWR
jgi:tRNA(Ser,Leu) C12 N-acetylase TAN1